MNSFRRKELNDYKQQIYNEASIEAQYIRDEEIMLRENTGFIKAFQDYINNVWYVSFYKNLFINL